MEYRKEKELKERGLAAKEKYWQLIDPNNESAICSKDEFIQALRELCNFESSYTAACLKVEDYEQNEVIDKNIERQYEEEKLIAEVEYYEAFCSFIETFYAQAQKKGGQSRSEKKAAASRENGRKGGRPKKTDMSISFST